MGKLDELKNKAKNMVTENRDRVEGGLDKAGEMINQRTGGKHEDKIDQGLAKAKEGLDRVEGTGGDQGATPPMPNQPRLRRPGDPEATNSEGGPLNVERAAFVVPIACRDTTIRYREEA